MKTKPETQPEISPCPFCGSKKNGICDFGENCLFVQCDVCGSTGPQPNEHIIRENAKSEAILLWNKRNANVEANAIITLGKDWLEQKDGAFDRFYDYLENHYAKQDKQ